MSNLRVIIAGGGTGGHIFPAVAIGHALQRIQPGTELLFVGANGRMEMEKVPQAGFNIVGLDIAGFDRSNMLKNLSLPFKVLKARMRARQILKDFAPNAVVGVGGYASFPMLSVAQGMNIPTLIQEQNSYAGKANKILGKKAKAICVAYEHMGRFFPKDKLLLTGNPVRKEITEMNTNADKAKSVFGFQNTVKTVLVVGGSLGAKAVNEAIDAGLDRLMQENVQLIWQTGNPYFEQAKKRAEAYNGRVTVMNFIREMPEAYTLADVVVSRAGALAIAELCIAAKPAIFVPLPTAAEDHQTSNAMALVNQHAAIMIRNDKAITDLVPAIKDLLANEDLQNEMKENLKALAIKDADERIAHKIIAIAK
jgi:UDP-N-acetylglucosamine--N-acetylmuramyl-(pentapeptide) pyrophosphoryl-undecaprenol N-acetylglucosamine transferase